jgi:hypothetical protein
MSRCMSTPAIGLSVYSISVRLDGQILHGVAVPARRLLAAGSGEDRRWACTIQRKPDALRLLWRGVFCRVLLYEVWPSGSGVACIYGTAWTSKRMMYCVLTPPGKAAPGAWPGHGCSAIGYGAARARDRRRLLCAGGIAGVCLWMDARPHIQYEAHASHPAQDRPHRPSTSQQPRSRPVDVSPPADQKARYRARPPDLARWRSTGRSVQRPTAIRCAVARLGLPVAGGPGKCAWWRGLPRAIHRGRDRLDGAMLLWAGPRRAAQLFRVQSWRNHHRAPSIPSPLPCRPLRAASTRPRLHPFPMAEGRGERPYSVRKVRHDRPPRTGPPA